MHLSDVFKFTQGLGQKGHQIGRKVGDAIELLVLGMIKLDDELTKFLAIEDGVEGATTAKHKVEFSFYNLGEGEPSKKTEDLFGIIECKKVGVEVTIKQNFKIWSKKSENKVNFHETNGYSFGINPKSTEFKWQLKFTSEVSNDSSNNARLLVEQFHKKDKIDSVIRNYTLQQGEKLLIALDTDSTLHVIEPSQSLMDIGGHLSKCIIITAKEVSANGITKIKVDDSLPGPQTPEKAKQASFVSLDVRKKVLGQFDINEEDKSFISILVIGEASHWEEKSRSMVRLCNNHNLIIPDNILVSLFQKFEIAFGENYQEKITKSEYKNSSDVKDLISELIEEYDRKIMLDMATDQYVEFKYKEVGGSNRIIIEPKE